MMSPVRGSRSGRAWREGEQDDEPDEAREGDERVAQTTLLGRRIVHGVGVVLDGDAIRPARCRRLERAQPRLDHTFGDECGDDREHDRRHDAEPVVGEDRERCAAGGTERLVGDLGDLGVDRAGDRVDTEDRADTGEARGHPGERVASDAHEGRCPERHEDQVTGVGRDARQDAHEDQHEREQPSWRRPDEQADERGHEPARLGDAGPHQRNECDRDDAEPREVRHERGEQEPDALGVEEAPDRDRDQLEVEAVLVTVVGHVRIEDRLGRILVVVRGDRDGVRDRDLVGHADPGERQRGGEQDHPDDEVQEHHHRVRDPVARALDDVEQAAHGSVFG